MTESSNMELEINTESENKIENKIENKKVKIIESKMEGFEFKDNNEKVKYIMSNEKSLWSILTRDEALSTMVVDMINKEIYGKNAPSIVKDGETVISKKLDDTDSGLDTDDDDDDDNEDKCVVA